MNTWDDKFDYLKLTRSLYLNVDYLQFLVEKVWKITKKVDVVDFGCGYGYLGLVLMPLLPEGSTYTGVDISDEQKSGKINWFIEQGFSKEEATEYLEKEIKLNEMFRNRDELNMVYAAAMTFCFGYVKK